MFCRDAALPIPLATIRTRLNFIGAVSAIPDEFAPAFTALAVPEAFTTALLLFSYAEFSIPGEPFGTVAIVANQAASAGTGDFFTAITAVGLDGIGSGRAGALSIYYFAAQALEVVATLLSRLISFLAFSTGWNRLFFASVSTCCGF